MHTATSIYIRAPREIVFSLASDVERWPEWLPRYRQIRAIGTGQRGPILEMAALCRGFTVFWTAEYWTDSRALELHFAHQTKWTRGMTVNWTLTPTRDGTRVEIVHHLKFFIPLLGWIAEPIISRFFCDHLSVETLAILKDLVEEEAAKVREKERAIGAT